MQVNDKNYEKLTGDLANCKFFKSQQDDATQRLRILVARIKMQRKEEMVLLHLMWSRSTWSIVCSLQEATSYGGRI